MINIEKFQKQIILSIKYCFDDFVKDLMESFIEGVKYDSGW